MTRHRHIALHFILVALAPASGAWAAVCPVPTLIQPSTTTTGSQLTADHATLQNGIAVATGHVRMQRNDQALEAPELQYDRNNGRAIAEHGLRYLHQGLSLRADTANVNVNDNTGRFTNASFWFSENGGRGNADDIESLGDNRYRMHIADYTTCAGDDPAWKITARRVDINRTSGRGAAFGAVMRFFNVPVLYTPYINFPIDDKRHTGLLVPTIGTSGNSGFELATPFYVNLAPQRDLTVTPRLLAERGLQLSGQFRYLNPHSHGEIDVSDLPSDNKTDSNRSLLHLDHIGRLSKHFGLQIDATRVSDDRYFEDLGSDLTSTSQSQLERTLRVTAAGRWARFSALAQNFQTLVEDNGLPASADPDPYEQLPEAQLSLLSPTAPWSVGLDTQAARFHRSDAIDGERYDLRPRLRWSRDRDSWFATGEAAYRYTRYDLNDTDLPGNNVIERGIPTLSLDTGIRLQRPLPGGWIQTLEPRAFYLFNGYERQDNIPLFDTGVPDLHFQRLFADNRFVGSDRIGDANQITLAVTSRFIEPDDGRTVVKLDLGRVYGFRNLRVRLPDRSPVGFGRRNSDIVGDIVYAPARHWQTTLTGQYDPGAQRFNRAGVNAGYDNNKGWRVQAGYRYFRNVRRVPRTGAVETVKETDLLAELPLGERWRVLGRWNYSLEKNQSVETLAGLEFRPSCCWAVRGAWRRYVHDSRGHKVTAVLLQLELTGLGRFGDKIDKLLDRDIVSGSSDDYNLVFR